MLKNRERYTNSIDKELLRKVKELAEQTRISQSKLIDEAIEDLLKKYQGKGSN
mgnify:CR=1 FL=1